MHDGLPPPVEGGRSSGVATEARRTPSTPEDLRARIRAAGLRVTDPRIAVLVHLEGAATPLSHAEVADRMTSKGWDRATIYRNLTDLTEAGLVHRTDVGDHIWRFEICREDATHAGPDHPHFVCNECGEVSCLPDEAVQIHAGFGVPGALRGADIEIQIKGRCDRCV